MIIVRHATLNDLDHLFELISLVDIGMTSLPKDKQVLSQRLAHNEATLKDAVAKDDGRYLFVLEDTDNGNLLGVSGVDVAIGKKEPFYEFQLMTEVHHSHMLNAYNQLQMLVLSSNYTGASELCSLFVVPKHRVGNNGKLISKARMLFIATHPERFSDKVIAEMRGFFDGDVSPFWQAFGAKFFKTDFATIDYLIGTANKGFIAEMIPRFPIYLDFLDDSVKAVIGKVHPNTMGALKLLESEGFRFNNYIDVIDGGPKMEATIADLRAVAQSQLKTVMIGVPNDQLSSNDGQGYSDKPNDNQATSDYLIGNEQFADFRASVIALNDKMAKQDTIYLDKKAATALNLTAGQQVRVLSLNDKR